MSLQLSSLKHEHKLISNAQYYVLKANNALDPNLLYFLYEYDWPTVSGGTKWIPSTVSDYPIADGWFENTLDDSITTTTSIGTAYGAKAFYNINTSTLLNGVSKTVHVTGYTDYMDDIDITVPIGSRLRPAVLSDNTYFHYEGIQWSADGDDPWTSATQIEILPNTNFALRVDLSYIVHRKYIDAATVGDLPTKYVNVRANVVDWMNEAPTTSEVAASSNVNRHFRGWFDHDTYTDGGDNYTGGSSYWGSSHNFSFLKGATLYAQYYYSPELVGVAGAIEVVEYDQVRYHNGTEWCKMYNWDDEDDLMDDLDESYLFAADQQTYFYMVELDWDWATDTTLKCARFAVKTGTYTSGTGGTKSNHSIYNKAIYTAGTVNVTWSNSYNEPRLWLQTIDAEDSSNVTGFNKPIITSWGFRGIDDFEDIWSTWFVTVFPPKVKLTGKKPDGTAYTWTGAYTSTTSFKRLFMFHSRDEIDYSDEYNSTIAGCVILKGTNANTAGGDPFNFGTGFTDSVNTIVSLRYPVTITVVA